MQPLMTQESYAKLSRMRSTLLAQGWPVSHVFVPVGPDLDREEAHDLRILFVGRATRGYGDERVSTLERATDRAIELASTYRKGNFWPFAERVVCRARNRLGLAGPTNFSRHGGWTNLIKVGTTTGNPPHQIVAAQAALCCAALRAEITHMNPHVVVVMTIVGHDDPGRSYAREEVFEPVFGRNDWNDIDRPTRWKDTLGTRIIQTYHPQGKPGRSRMADLIGDLAAHHLGLLR